MFILVRMGASHVDAVIRVKRHLPGDAPNLTVQVLLPGRGFIRFSVGVEINSLTEASSAMAT